MSCLGWDSLYRALQTMFFYFLGSTSQLGFFKFSGRKCVGILENGPTSKYFLNPSDVDGKGADKISTKYGYLMR